MSNREQIINSLSLLVGIDTSKRYRIGDSYYDPSTGTLYCHGMAINKSTAELAIAHFEKMEARCDSSDPASRDLILIYRCAIEAIKMMKDPDAMEALRKKFAQKDESSES